MPAAEAPGGGLRALRLALAALEAPSRPACALRPPPPTFPTRRPACTACLGASPLGSCDLARRRGPRQSVSAASLVWLFAVPRMAACAPAVARAAGAALGSWGAVERSERAGDLAPRALACAVVAAGGAECPQQAWECPDQRERGEGICGGEGGEGRRRRRRADVAEWACQRGGRPRGLPAWVWRACPCALHSPCAPRRAERTRAEGRRAPLAAALALTRMQTVTATGSAPVNEGPWGP